MPVNRAPIYKKQLIGQIFLKSGLLSKEHLKEALEVQKKEGGFLGELLIKLNYLSEVDIAMGLSSQCGIPFLSPLKYKVPQKVLEVVPKEMALKFNFMPIDKFGDTLTICMVNPLDEASQEKIADFTHLTVMPGIATAGEIKGAIEKFYKKS
jgi:type IV pilus assembly protein PilB